MVKDLMENITDVSHFVWFDFIVAVMEDGKLDSKRT
jgi:hypothetical protein